MRLWSSILRLAWPKLRYQLGKYGKHFLLFAHHEWESIFPDPRSARLDHHRCPTVYNLDQIYTDSTVLSNIFVFSAIAAEDRIGECVIWHVGDNLLNIL